MSAIIGLLPSTGPRALSVAIHEDGQFAATFAGVARTVAATVKRAGPLGAQNPVPRGHDDLPGPRSSIRAQPRRNAPTPELGLAELPVRPSPDPVATPDGSAPPTAEGGFALEAPGAFAGHSGDEQLRIPSADRTTPKAAVHPVARTIPNSIAPLAPEPGRFHPEARGRSRSGSSTTRDLASPVLIRVDEPGKFGAASAEMAPAGLSIKDALPGSLPIAASAARQDAARAWNTPHAAPSSGAHADDDRTTPVGLATAATRTPVPLAAPYGGAGLPGVEDRVVLKSKAGNPPLPGSILHVVTRPQPIALSDHSSTPDALSTEPPSFLSEADRSPRLEGPPVLADWTGEQNSKTRPDPDAGALAAGAAVSHDRPRINPASALSTGAIPGAPAPERSEANAFSQEAAPVSAHKSSRDTPTVDATFQAAPTESTAVARLAVADPARAGPFALGRSTEVWAPEIARNIVALAVDAPHSVRLKLAPPELGELTLAVDLRDGTLGATLTASTQTAHAALIAADPALREAVAVTGLALARLDVAFGQDRPTGQQTPDAPPEPAPAPAPAPANRTGAPAANPVEVRAVHMGAIDVDA